MKLSISFKALLLLVATFLLLSASALPAFANHPEDEANDDAEMHEEHSHSDSEGGSSRLEKMEQLLALLEQLAAILTERVGNQTAADAIADHHHGGVGDDHASENADEHAHEHGSEEDSDELRIWIEVHDGVTHVHLDIPDEEFKTYFFDDIAYTDEAAVIAEIANREDLTVEEIEAVIVFPTEDAEEYAGIHIMADGSVMTGEGVVLDDATINDDGMIVLEDGTILEPAFDLR